MTTNLPFLRWLVAHPAVRAGETTTAFLIEHPPLSAPPLALAGPARGAAASGSTSPRPPPAAPPDVDGAAHDHGAPARAERADRADAGHGDPGARRRGRHASSRASRCVVLEAMKMETPVVSPYEATVRAVHVRGRRPRRRRRVLVELEE